MLDMNASELVLEAQLAQRRRELIAMRRHVAVPGRRLSDLRVGLAGALAHLAVHLDRGSVGTIAARHPHTAARN